MRAIEAKTFSGYGGLRQTELPKPQPAKDRVLVRVTAAGVTPLEYTVLSGAHPRAKAPLVLGNEGAGQPLGVISTSSTMSASGPYFALALADREPFAPQDLPALCVTLDLVS
jgi:D-arabinose 1-dehydrogenase-like Zn-dependent alcohol dehydrogenase